MVDIIPKKQKKASPWDKITYGAGALLAAIVLSYGILFYFSAKASVGLGDLNGRIAGVGTADDRIAEKAVLGHKRKIEDFADLLSGRITSAWFFGNFEKNIHPNVWFLSFDLNIPKMELTVSGQTANFQTLDQQLAIFKKDENVSQVNLSNLSVGKNGEAEFSINLSLKPEMFSR